MNPRRPTEDPVRPGDPLSFLQNEPVESILSHRRDRSSASVGSGLVGAGVTVLVLAATFYLARSHGLAPFAPIAGAAADPSAPTASADQPDPPTPSPSGEREPVPPPAAPLVVARHQAPRPGYRQEILTPGTPFNPSQDDPPAAPDQPAEKPETPEDSPGHFRDESDGSPMRRDLNEARRTYSEQIAQLDQDLLDRVGKAEEEALRANDSEKLARIRKAREGFEKRGEPPSGAVPTKEYVKARKAAENDLRHIYKKAEATLLAAGNAKDARAVIAELDDLTASSDDDRFLRKHGLSRWHGYSIVREAEDRVARKAPETQRLHASVDQIVGKLNVIEEQDRTISAGRNRLAQLETAITNLELQLREIRDIPANRARIDEIKQAIKIRKTGPLPDGGPAQTELANLLRNWVAESASPAVRAQLRAELEQKKGPFVESLNELAALVSEMNKGYAAFRYDQDVKDAVKRLKLKLGPSDGPREIRQWVANAQRWIKRLDPQIKTFADVPASSGSRG